MFCERHRLSLAKELVYRGGVVLHHSLTLFTVLSAATMSLKSCFVQTRANAGIIRESLSAHLSCCYHAHHDAPLGRSGVGRLQDEIKRQTKTWEGTEGSCVFTSLTEPLGLQVAEAVFSHALITSQPHPSNFYWLWIKLSPQESSGNHFEWSSGRGGHTHTQQLLVWNPNIDVKPAINYLRLHVHM